MTAPGGEPVPIVGPARRRGRRPAGADTRQGIVDAARSEFASRGYEGATKRGIARAAGVDARLVHHYFDSKDDVFVAALDLPARPQELIAGVIAGGVDGLGERLLRTFFGVWDTPAGRERVVALVSSLLTNQGAARMLKEFLVREVFGRIAASIGADDPQLRASLAASQMIGVLMARYVIELEPLASADAAELVPILAPTIQRYLTGDLD